MHQPSHKINEITEDMKNGLNIAGKAAKSQFFLLDFD